MLIVVVPLFLMEKGNDDKSVIVLMMAVFGLLSDRLLAQYGVIVNGRKAENVASTLLIIDVQQSFLYRPFWREDDLPAFQQALTRLIAGCQQQGVTLVDVFHIAPEGSFSLASGYVKPFSFLSHQAAVTIHKRVHDGQPVGSHPQYYYRYDYYWHSHYRHSRLTSATLFFQEISHWDNPFTGYGDIIQS